VVLMGIAQSWPEFRVAVAKVKAIDSVKLVKDVFSGSVVKENTEPMKWRLFIITCCTVHGECPVGR